MTPLVRNFLTGTQVRIPIVRVVPVHLELAVVPIRVRDIAVRIARTVFLFAFVHLTDNPHWDFLCCPGVKQA
jgi:hypothetical protein